MSSEPSALSRKVLELRTFAQSSFESLQSGLGNRPLAVTFGFAFLLLVAFELQTSWVQSRAWATIARHSSFRTEAGAISAIPYPGSGPYDERVGYSQLPSFLNRLKAADFSVEAQARVSTLYLLLSRLRIYPVYNEKDQTGLSVLDRHSKPLYTAQYPARIYEHFSQIPPLIVNSVLFIENRQILDSRHPYQNPAIDWGRFSRALLDLGLHEIDHRYPIIGGSTLATQLEKMRHSPDGRTHSAPEKLRQMISASLRAYQDGPDTLAQQRQIVCDYLNSIPLAAVPFRGEVFGLADGLWEWYGADFDRVNRLLNAPGNTLNQQQQRQQALAYRRVLSLLLAARAPSHYLVNDRKALADQTNRYLRVLSKAGVISSQLRDMALAETPGLRVPFISFQRTAFVGNKAPEEARTALLRLLDLALSSATKDS